MKTETRKKTIHYKNAVFTNSEISLQDLLEVLVDKDEAVFNVGGRVENIDADNTSKRFINHHKNFSGMFFGQLIFLEHGKSQELIEVDAEAQFCNIKSLLPSSIKYANETSEEAEAKRREFINSFLYFGVFGNHLVVLQSAALRTRELETHLNWLLGTKTSKIPNKSALVLQGKPTLETIKKVEKTPVKKIKIGSPIDTVDSVDEKIENKSLILKDSYQTKTVKYKPTGMGMDVVKAILGDNVFNKLSFDDSLDEANLKVNLEITYSRKTSSQGQKVLDDIATSMRHIDDADVKIDLVGGGTIHGKDLKLSGDISVKMIKGKVDENDLYHQMHAWLVSKIDDKEIELEDDPE